MSLLSSRLRRGSALATAFSVAAITVLIPAAASAEPVGAIQQVSVFTPEQDFTNCGSAATATNPTSGVTVAAWAGPTVGLTSASININVLGAGGVVGPVATFQPDESVPLSQPANCNPLSIDAGANGGFIVTWMDDIDSAIYGVLVSSAGAFITSEFLISSNVNYDDIETVSAAWSEADSRYLVTWKARVLTPFPAAAGGQQVVGRFVDGAAVVYGADFLITDLAVQIDNSQDVAFGAGRWVSVGVGSSDGLVYVSTVTAAGVVTPSLALASPSANGASVDFNPTTQQFLVVSRGGGSVWGQLLDSAGVPVGSSFVIAASSGSRPRVASLGVDGWLVAWHTGGNFGARDVLGIELSTAGAPLGAVEAISSGADDLAVESNFRPEVAFSAATGEAYVVWTRHVVADDATNVVARAWAVTAPAAVPAAGPTLPAAGPDTDRVALLGGVGVITLAAGALLVLRRRTARAAVIAPVGG